MQTLERSVNHSRTSDLHPVMAAGCCLTSDAAALCLLVKPNERNPPEPSFSYHFDGLRFGVGLDDSRG